MGTCPVVAYTPSRVDIRTLKDGEGQCVALVQQRLQTLLGHPEHGWTPETCRVLLLHQRPCSYSSADVHQRGFSFHMALATYEHNSWYYESSRGEQYGHIKCSLRYKLNHHPPLRIQLLVPHYEVLRRKKDIERWLCFAKQQHVQLPKDIDYNHFRAQRMSIPDIHMQTCLFTHGDTYYSYVADKQMPFTIHTLHTKEHSVDDMMEWFDSIVNHM